MKRVDAIIRPENLDMVKDRLAQIGVEGFAVTKITGLGKQKGYAIYRCAEYREDFLPKLLLTVVADEKQVSEIVESIIEGARTGQVGDGKIFVTALDEVICIRTGGIDKAAC